jgi:hypothetical protein
MKIWKTNAGNAVEILFGCRGGLPGRLLLLLLFFPVLSTRVMLARKKRQNQIKYKLSVCNSKKYDYLYCVKKIAARRSVPIHPCGFNFKK